ncbi:hypothetical protein BDZ94DRAFT_1315752 [Collybia nuda]|uniref:Uncharacterized protein n=1 Tax=Collybia nuda TaxID=64659 RepID=A0A9P5XUB7_9AGAR|nr:hypothetical protein BDZ94DRAFT_1315752 [Collybia nuda]
MAGTLKKDLPKRPVRPLKPKPAPVATSSAVQVEDLEEEQDGRSEEDDDEFEVHTTFAQIFPEDKLEPWQPNKYHKHPAFEFGNHYFTHRNNATREEIIPFKDSIDPHHLLKNSMGNDYIRIQENNVEYFECYNGVDGSKYKNVNPVIFRIGDIVEVQFSFIAISIRGGAYKILNVLRALTLLDSKPRIEAEIRHSQATHHPIRTITLKMKRQVGYLDDEEEGAQKKVAKMTIND